MSRRRPPDHRDPRAKAGLTARRVAAGLPVGRIEPRECPGHPCEDAADLYPHAGIGDVFYCNGNCRGGA